jgi:hypothetical protein
MRGEAELDRRDTDLDVGRKPRGIARFGYEIIVTRSHRHHLDDAPVARQPTTALGAPPNVSRAPARVRAHIANRIWVALRTKDTSARSAVVVRTANSRRCWWTMSSAR